MKTIVAAMALAFAYPAAAQTAAPDPHAGHAQHQQGEHKEAGHKEGRHADCCCEKMGSGGKMKCCDEQGRQGQSEQHSGHSGKH